MKVKSVKRMGKKWGKREEEADKAGDVYLRGKEINLMCVCVCAYVTGRNNKQINKAVCFA